MNLSSDQIEEIAVKAVKRAFRDMGIDDSDPFEMRKDFQYLREWRVTMEQVKSRGIIYTLGLIISGLIALIVLGVKGWLVH